MQKKLRRKKIGICLILGRIRIQNRTRMDPDLDPEPDPDPDHHPGSRSADPDPDPYHFDADQTLDRNTGFLKSLPERILLILFLSSSSWRASSRCNISRFFSSELWSSSSRSSTQHTTLIFSFSGIKRMMVFEKKEIAT